MFYEDQAGGDETQLEKYPTAKKMCFASLNIQNSIFNSTFYASERVVKCCSDTEKNSREPGV